MPVVEVEAEKTAHQPNNQHETENAEESPDVLPELLMEEYQDDDDQY